MAHEHGAKVTAHCFGEAVLPGLIGAGIDCIEHGTGLSEDLIDEMVAHVALVPTVMQLNNFPDYADAAGEKFPAYAEHMRDLHDRRRDTIMAAYEAGVAIYAGTDAGGVLPARQHRRRGARARRLRLQRRRRPGCRVLAGARVARARRRPLRGHDGRLRRLRPRPARGPLGAGRPEAASCCVGGSLADPDPRLVDALRAAGCVFAEEEAALLQEEARDAR